MIENEGIRDISELYHTKEIQQASNARKAQRRGESSKRPSTRYEDRFTPSYETEELRRIRRLLDSIPDMQEDKVREIREKIRAGEYKIKAEDIAEKIIKTAIL